MHPERYFEPYKTSPLSDLMLKGKFYFFVKSKWVWPRIELAHTWCPTISECLNTVLPYKIVVSLASPRLIKQTEFYFRSATALYPTKCRLRIFRHLSLVCQSVASPKGSRRDLNFSNLFGFEVSGGNLSPFRPRQINLARIRLFNHLF